MTRADYGRIADSYDRARPLSERNVELWLSLIQRLLPSGNAKLLDLGCGTGRFALPIASRLQVQVTGADSSEAMLARAREKDSAGSVRWNCQNAEELTYPSGSFDVVFTSHLLHHMDAPIRVVRECWRVLNAPGVLLVRYGAIEQIVNDVEHVFFPEAVSIDEERTPAVGDVEQWLREVGFLDVESQEVVQQTYASAADRLAAVKARSTSVLTLIPEQAFDEGVRRLAEHIDGHPGEPWLLRDGMTLTWGRKPTGFREHGQ